MTDAQRTARAKRADLASSGGAGVLGAGIGVLLASVAAPYAPLLLLLGIVLHGWGMLEKRRLKADVPIPGWSRALFWLCWLALAGILLWIGVPAVLG